jgi:hypothetical protein
MYRQRAIDGNPSTSMAHAVSEMLAPWLLTFSRRPSATRETGESAAPRRDPRKLERPAASAGTDFEPQRFFHPGLWMFLP